MGTSIQKPASTGMELLSKLVEKNTDPQAAIEIAKQIVCLQVQQESLRQSQDRFDWEKQDRQARVAFSEAIERFKANAPKILKSKHVSFPNKSGGQTDYWHVELDKACDLLIPALLKEGLTHRWKSTDLPGGVTRVTCFIRHRLGYEEEGASLAGPADQSGGKNPIQGVGSSTSYLERYTFLASIGIVPTGADNDGNPPGISLEEGGGFIDSIRQAETATDVMVAWGLAIGAAKKLDPMDYRSMTIFTEARDERLKEFKRAK